MMPICCAVVMTILRKYIHMLNYVSTANYEGAVTSDVANVFFSMVELANSENLPSLDASVLRAVKIFVSAAADEEETVLKFVASLFFYNCIIHRGP